MDDPLENVEEFEDLEEETQELVEHFKSIGGFDHLVDRLTGRDGGLRPSKPRAKGDTGLEQYVWRMARFHSNADPSMPVTASWDLHHWGRETFGYERRSLAERQIERILDFVARVCVMRLGGDPDAGYKRWEKALYG